MTQPTTFEKALQEAARLKPEDILIRDIGGTPALYFIKTKERDVEFFEFINSDQIDTLAGLFGWEYEVGRLDDHGMVCEGWIGVAWGFTIEPMRPELVFTKRCTTKLLAARAAFTAIMEIQEEGK